MIKDGQMLFAPTGQRFNDQRRANVICPNVIEAGQTGMDCREIQFSLYLTKDSFLSDPTGGVIVNSKPYPSLVM
jgi:hypothetical protein